MNWTLKGTSAVGMAGVAAMCLGLSACLPPKSMWSENDTIKRNTVTLHHITHDVTFGADTTGLSDTQAAALDKFLANVMAGYGDEFSIETPSNDVSGDRRMAVSSYLKARGLVVSGIPGGLWRPAGFELRSRDPEPLCRHAAALPRLAQAGRRRLQQSGQAAISAARRKPISA